jgi:hypothetical protein
MAARKVLEHDPEKWLPVFRKDHAQSKSWSDDRFALGYGSAPF